MGEHLTEHLGFLLPNEIVAEPGHGPRFRWPRNGVCDKCHRIRFALYRAWTGEAWCFEDIADVTRSRKFLRGRREPEAPLRPFDYEWWNRHFDGAV